MEFEIGDPFIYELNNYNNPKWDFDTACHGSGKFAVGEITSVEISKIVVGSAYGLWTWPKEQIIKRKGKDGYGIPLRYKGRSFLNRKTKAHFYGRLTIDLNEKAKVGFPIKVCNDPLDKNYSTYLCLNLNKTPELGPLTSPRVGLLEFDKISKTTYYKLKDKYGV